MTGMCAAAARSTGGDQSIPISRGQGDAIHVLRDHRIHDLNLAAEIRFSGRAIPQNIDIEFSARIESALLHRQPEHVRCRLRDDCDSPLLAPSAGR